ncbi:hypothetical protein [Haloferula sp.]|uniref:hypothetical protein n=1 Tax=Haloferula sp. TaxID=2497595 RepID=UPI003C7236CB
MAFADTWHIRSRARQCALTEQAFSEGEKIITALFPDPESSGYLRKDFKTDAWNARSEAEETPFSFWRSTYVPTETHEKVDPMAKEDPETLLRRLIEEDEEHTENVRYILAVMLERKKLLRETDSQRTPSGILRIYEHRKEGDVFIVRDPDIPLAEVETVQEEVFALLESGGRLPEAEPETTAEPEANAESVIIDPESDTQKPEAVESSNSEPGEADALASSDPENPEEPSNEPTPQEEESK